MDWVMNLNFNRFFTLKVWTPHYIHMYKYIFACASPFIFVRISDDPLHSNEEKSISHSEKQNQRWNWKTLLKWNDSRRNSNNNNWQQQQAVSSSCQQKQQTQHAHVQFWPLLQYECALFWYIYPLGVIWRRSFNGVKILWLLDKLQAS